MVMVILNLLETNQQKWLIKTLVKTAVAKTKTVNVVNVKIANAILVIVANAKNVIAKINKKRD